MGFLMTLRYPGTDLELTGVRNGPASWWLSSSAKSILMRGKAQINDTDSSAHQNNTSWAVLYLHMARSLLSSRTVLGFFTHAGFGEGFSSVLLFFISFDTFLGVLLALPESSSELSPATDGFLWRLASAGFFRPPLERFKGFLVFRDWLLACTEPERVMRKPDLQTLWSLHCCRSHAHSGAVRGPLSF